MEEDDEEDDETLAAAAAEAQRQYGVGDEDQYSDKRVTGQPKAKHREW